MTAWVHKTASTGVYTKSCFKDTGKRDAGFDGIPSRSVVLILTSWSWYSLWGCWPAAGLALQWPKSTLSQSRFIYPMEVGRANQGHDLFNKKMSSYLYRKSHCGNKTVVRSSYYHNGDSHTIDSGSVGQSAVLARSIARSIALIEITSLYWIGPSCIKQNKNHIRQHTPSYWLRLDIDPTRMCRIDVFSTSVWWTLLFACASSVPNISSVTGNRDLCQTSNTSRTLVGNRIVDHSDVVGATPVGAAPTTSSFSTLMALINWAKTTSRREAFKFWNLVPLTLEIWWYA